MIRTKTEEPLAQKMWALGLLVVLVAAGLTLAAGPAHAETFTVDSTIDPGNGTCSVTAGCTLREAITAANDAPGRDSIAFNIPGAGVKTITPIFELPKITEAVTIDGYTQPGSRPNSRASGAIDAVVLIELDGFTLESGQEGLIIDASNVVVRGLAINRFLAHGINVVGGAGTRIEGNFLGTDASGTLDRGNSASGVNIEFGSRQATVGGTEPEARNLISGNNGFGVEIDGVGGNKVQGNLIGTQKNGTTIIGGAQAGVFTESPKNTIGGAEPEAGNVIAFNSGGGVEVADSSASFSVTGNRVLSNSIFANGALGIDLNTNGRTANDPRDLDAGPNNLQNFPVLTSAVFDGTTIVKGTLESTPSTRKKKRAFTVQLFANPSADRDEGKTFLGQKRVTTNRRGKASFTFVTDRVVTGMITATATGPGGNTSEFSDPLGVSSI